MLLTTFIIVNLNLVILVGAQRSLVALVFTLSHSAVFQFFFGGGLDFMLSH